MATRIKKTDLARDALYDKVNTMIDEVNTKIDNKDSLPSQTGNAGKFLTTDGTNASWGKVKQIEIKQDLTNPTIDTVPSTKAVKDESSRITTLMNTKVSNCITEIPQDIKLELNNGTLTLKAGSKVYVPNGVGVFDEVIIDSDLTTSIADNNKLFIFYNLSTNGLWFSSMPATQSGTTNPSNLWGFFYNSTDNKVYYLRNNITPDNYTFSLPVAMVISNGTQITSIDQVFNGFGYIGSTVFALPGVKGLIPNGRNADGSLKSIEVITDKVITYTNPSNFSYRGSFIITNDLSLLASDQTYWKYNQQENLFKHESSVGTFCEFSLFENVNGRITSFTPKTVFHALDYNDKSTISGWGMPSSRYIDLTLGASGSTYTAPANGYFYVFGNNTDFNCYLHLINVTKEIRSISWMYATTGNKNACYLPVSKGDVLKLEYWEFSSTSFRFIYAEGESYNPVSSSDDDFGPAEGGSIEIGGIGGGQ